MGLDRLGRRQAAQYKKAADVARGLPAALVVWRRSQHSPHIYIRGFHVVVDIDEARGFYWEVLRDFAPFHEHHEVWHGVDFVVEALPDDFDVRGFQAALEKKAAWVRANSGPPRKKVR